MTTVELDHIGVTINTIPVLTDVTLTVRPGEVVGIAGPNGAGKTTLLSVASTLLAPTAGSGTVLGARLGTRQTLGVRPSIGWSGHDAGLYPELTLAENIRLWAELAGRSRTDADETLDIVGLAAAADRRADHSSNGMQRRVDLARLLMLEPMLVLLDEAHAGLDEPAEAIVDEIVDRVRGRGGSALLVSHDAKRLAGRTDRVEQIVEGTLR